MTTNKEEVLNKIKSAIIPTAALIAFLLLLGITGKSDYEDKVEEMDNPYNNTYFDYKENAFVPRPYDLPLSEKNTRSFKEHADAFNKCNKSCHSKNMVPQDYLHDYTGSCRCLTIKDKIAYEKQTKSR